MKSYRRVLFFTLAVVVLLAVDLMSKYLVVHYGIDYLPVFTIPPGISFALESVYNRGGAWGILADYSLPLLLFRMAMVVAIFGYLAFFNQSRKLAFPLLLIVTGAIGNIVDCFVYGHVVDMLHFTFRGRSYGIFNVADSYIFVGCMAMMLLLMQKKESGYGKERESGE